MPNCSVVSKSWSELTTTDLYSFLKLRTDVFFLEQRINETELDWRDSEEATRHFWVADAAGAAAYLRVLVDDAPTHHDAAHIIGRVVVREDRRGEGLAQVLISEVLQQYGHLPFVLHAQEYVAPLYAKFGFLPAGDVFEEAGMPHLTMYRAAVMPADPGSEPTTLSA